MKKYKILLRKSYSSELPKLILMCEDNPVMIIYNLYNHTEHNLILNYKRYTNKRGTDELMFIKIKKSTYKYLKLNLDTNYFSGVNDTNTELGKVFKLMKKTIYKIENIKLLNKQINND